MTTIEVSDTPRKAPADHGALAPKIVVKDGGGLWETWHGSGIPTMETCGSCGNVEGNKKIYGNWGHSYPNGNSWNDSEIVCGQCGRYTLTMEFTEG